MRVYSLPDNIQEAIGKAVSSLGADLGDSKTIATCIKKLSDFFIQNPDGQTPWEQDWAQIAYVAYYFPLNFLRNQSVVAEAKRQNFFTGIETAVDFGTGLTSAATAILLESQKIEFSLIERSRVPEKIAEQFFLPKESKRQWNPPQFAKRNHDLSVFSYSLTELKNIPDWAWNAKALMIVEPSTQQDGRILLSLREELIKNGFSILAPCTHQLACPMLTHSKNDWCHDRIHFNAPPWFLEFEKHLPFRNRTLTMSYLLASKKPPVSAMHEKIARTTGDLMNEKGKSRQMICRGTEREFLAWMHKAGAPQEIPRGVLVEIPSSSKKVSNEIRLEQEIKEIVSI